MISVICVKSSPLGGASALKLSWHFPAAFPIFQRRSIIHHCGSSTMNPIHMIEIILYVRDQQASAVFYQKIFRKAPDLDVPGMTEFILAEQVKLGLMPNRGIAKILGDTLPHPDEGSGIPRCELYLYVDDLPFEYENALKAGSRSLSPPALRDWGDTVCYFADPDGHVIAFAEKTRRNSG